VQTAEGGAARGKENARVNPQPRRGLTSIVYESCTPFGVLVICCIIIPCDTSRTIWLFQENLIKKSLEEKLFEQFRQYLHDLGLYNMCRYEQIERLKLLTIKRS
jgi:hypothetical protein